MTTYNAGDYTVGGVKRTCLLDEGAVTVSTAYGIGGGSAATYTFAAEIKKGMVVAISSDTLNTWDNTGGSLLVDKPATGETALLGIVISEPEFTKKPASTAAAASLTLNLAAKTLRVATVWFPGVTAITRATLNCANASAITPGVLDKLKIDVSACNAASGLFVVDVASGGGSTICPLHYVAQDSGSSVVAPIMIAFFGGQTVALT
jgi:hypothetical protein